MIQGSLSAVRPSAISRDDGTFEKVPCCVDSDRAMAIGIIPIVRSSLFPRSFRLFHMICLTAVEASHTVITCTRP